MRTYEATKVEVDDLTQSPAVILSASPSTYKSRKAQHKLEGQQQVEQPSSAGTTPMKCQIRKCLTF